MEAVKLESLAKDEVPQQLRVEAYFDFDAHPFAHRALFEGEEIKSVIDVLSRISGYAKSWLAGKVEEMSKAGSVKTLTEKDFPGRGTGSFRALVAEGAQFDPAYYVGAPEGATPSTICLDKGARLIGSNPYLNEGDIYIGCDAIIEPGVGIKGPTIIMEGNEIRQGTYLRGNVILGSNSGGTAFRGELKNTVMMDDANFPHPSYLGDSICGHATHFGNQVTAANLGIFQGLRERAKRTNVVIFIDDKPYDLGLVKMGVIMGDFTQVGCNSVIAPGTLMGKQCVAYGLCMIDRGLYPDRTLFKNKPINKKVIEVVGVNADRI